MLKSMMILGKRSLFLSLFSLFFISTLVAQDAGKTPAPYQPPALTQEDGWTLAVIPDPQGYSRYSRNQGILDMMTAWLAENKSKLNILEVVCVGDLVESNGLQRGEERFANQTWLAMWTSVSRAFERLDGVYPYALVTGNHDYGPDIFPDGNHYGTRSSLTRETHFPEFFPITRNPAWKDVLIETALNAYGKATLENAAYEWTASGGQKILLVTVEFAPRDEALAWAKEVFNRPEYADHFGILVTHSYLHAENNGNKRIESEGYALNQAGGNAGEAIWRKLVEPTPNIRLVLSGHVSAADDFTGCCGFAVDHNSAGKPVYQMVFNTQAMGGGWEGNGGDGWLRLLEFSKGLDHVKVRTFSPFLAISPISRDSAWSHLPCCEFEFDIE